MKKSIDIIEAYLFYHKIPVDALFKEIPREQTPIRVTVLIHVELSHGF